MREVFGAGAGRIVWWGGVVPSQCDRCSARLSTVFVDCKSTVGAWGCFCVGCAGEVAVSAEPPLCRVFQRCDGGFVSIF